MPKSLKECKSPGEERTYVADGRLSENDWSGMEDVELLTGASRGEVVSMRFDSGVTRQLRSLAKRQGVAHTTLVREWVLERLDSELKPHLKVKSGGRK